MITDNTKRLLENCRLALAGSEESTLGELWYSGGQYIFVSTETSVTDGISSTDWKSTDLTGKMVLRIPIGYSYFERRGVFVMRADPFLLNAACIDKLGSPSWIKKGSYEPAYKVQV